MPELYQNILSIFQLQEMLHEANCMLINGTMLFTKWITVDWTQYAHTH
jgi:hypothetical protein